MEQPLTLPEFMAAIRPELERQVDVLILSQPPHERALLTKHREALIRQLATTTELMNWRRRAELAEDRLRPKLVEE